MKPPSTPKKHTLSQVLTAAKHSKQSLSILSSLFVSFQSPDCFFLFELIFFLALEIGTNTSSVINIQHPRTKPKLLPTLFSFLVHYYFSSVGIDTPTTNSDSYGQIKHFFLLKRYDCRSALHLCHAKMFLTGTRINIQHRIAQPKSYYQIYPGCFVSMDAA